MSFTKLIIDGIIYKCGYKIAHSIDKQEIYFTDGKLSIKWKCTSCYKKLIYEISVNQIGDNL